MNLFKLIEETLQPVLQDVLTIIGYDEKETPVIFSHQNGLEPQNTYCVLNILGLHKIGFKDEGTWVIDVDINGEEVSVLETIQHYRLDTQLSFIGKNGCNVGFDFKHELENNRRCWEHLMINNFGIVRKGDARRIPQKRESEWVDACNYDVSFSFSIYTRSAYDWVEWIVVKGDGQPPEMIRIYNEED